MLLNLLHLFALFGFAVAAPVFGLLRDNPEFMIAHGVGGAELARLVATMTLGLPLVVWPLELALRPIAAAAARGLHLYFVGLLVAMTSLPPLLRALPDAGNAAVTLPALAIGGGAAYLYARFASVRNFVSVLAVGPLLFTAMFWFDESIAKVRSAADFDTAVAPKAVNAKVDGPIVWIIFDELPLASLLDAKGEIDAQRFPHFAGVARDATWFRDTAAVAEETAMALPPIVTGRYPEEGRLPIASDHPENLFSLLAPSFEMNVVETRSLLHRRAAPQPGEREGAGRFHTDLAILFAHVIAPPALSERLPVVDEDWKGFGAPRPDEIEQIQKRDYSDRLKAFGRFLDGFEGCEARCLHFAHVVLPHVPWQHLPSGQQYSPAFSFGVERERGRWVDDPWWSTEGQKRHLLQLAFVDALLGMVIEELRSRDLYDASLLVVTADHGASFWPGQTRRLLEGHSHPGDILRVPLLVKAPFQTEGRISDTPISTIDILPTVLDLLDIPPQWETDGHSAAAPDFTGRERRIAFDMEGGRHEYGRGELDVAESIAQALGRFDNADGYAGMFAAGRYGGLVGRSPSEFELRPTGRLRLELASEPFELARRSDAMSHARLSGRFWVPQVAPGEHHVAVSLRGRIVIVAPTWRTALLQRAFTVVGSDAIGVAKVDELSFHLVTGPPDQPVLQLARPELAPIQKKLHRVFNRDPAALAR
jgi:hypothetical protein